MTAVKATLRARSEGEESGGTVPLRFSTAGQPNRPPDTERYGSTPTAGR